jgi:hypothetical protein
MVSASLNSLELFDTGRASPNQEVPCVTSTSLHWVKCISWAPDEQHFIATTNCLVLYVFEILANNEIKEIHKFHEMEFGWFIDTKRFACFREGFLECPKPGAVLYIGQIGSHDSDKRELESHEPSAMRSERFPVAYAQNILIQAKDNVVKAWLVDHSREIAPLIGTHQADVKIQDVRISHSGQWAVTHDGLANVEIHKIDPVAMNFTRLFRLDSTQSGSRFQEVVGLAEASSSARLILAVLAVSGTGNYVTVHEVGTEVRQITAAEGDVAMLSPNGKFLYTTSQNYRLRNTLTITRIHESRSSYVIDLGLLRPNRIDASPTGDLLLAWKYDGGSISGWQLDVGESSGAC